MIALDEQGGQQLRVPSGAEVRDELEALVLADLLGPAGGPEEEVTEDRVSERYLVGMLAPKRLWVLQDSHDPVAVAESGVGDDEPEPSAPPARTFFQSSVGFTCCVDATAGELVATAAWGHYTRTVSETPDAEGKPQRVWRRRHAGGAVRVPLVAGEFEAGAPDPEQADVVVRGRVRAANGQWLVTVFLDNQQVEPLRSKDERWLFQVELSLAPADGAAVFRQRPVAEAGREDDDDVSELRRLDMAYRDQVEFARGHGIGVHAEVDPDEPRRATRIVAWTVPRYEVPRTDIPTERDFPELAGVELDMAALAFRSGGELVRVLTPLVDAYDAWINRQVRRIDDPAARLGGYGNNATEALYECRKAADRIRAGIRLLGRDAHAAEAFRFANHAMWLQRIRGRLVERRRNDQALDVTAVLREEDQPRNRSWRPFQLAFILLNLPSLTDPLHPDRSGDRGGDHLGVVDLLAFPTGGGKTEAYLGLTAFTLALRRLQASGTAPGAGPGGHADGAGRFDGAGDGVAVLMRYTLRLLTLQQFQRAAALLCACETIRERKLAEGDRRWGTTPFRIGLWVGRAATPTTTAEAKQWVERTRNAAGGRPIGGGSPAQLTLCPWCGTPIDEGRDIVVDPDLDRTLIYCGDAYGTCPFSQARRKGEGLPVVVVDHEVYRLLPALLIGTVDKFAQMPWQGAVQTLFGRVAGRCERHGWRTPDLDHPDSHPRRGSLPPARTVPAGPLRPPDLIIQDELHLIAGPLGSMVGLYETAVDKLCSWEAAGRQVRPKVIASTATVREARRQAHALFLRGLHLFPPPGLDAGDSFFALQRPVAEVPGRRYLGVCAHGRRLRGALIRVYVALLGAAQTLHAKYGGAATVDPYMTLLGYFNSMRELGGMRRLVEDDVATRLDKIDQRGLTRRTLRGSDVQELTSRLGSAEIPKVLDRLSVRAGPARPKGGPYPIDVLLATNMVSVGVDVPRLGLMVVAGQPKATAEYIQATSRIGREHPGLVVTVYHWARPRDLSHFESFEHYHASFYRQVEALSVTPFAARAMDRGLTALLAALVRLDGTGLNPNRAAGKLDRNAPEVAAAVGSIRERAALVADPAAGEQAGAMLESLLDEWAHEAAKPGRTLAYKGRAGQGDAVALLRDPDALGWSRWTCPQSMRDVESGIGLLLVEGDLGGSAAPPFEPPPAGQGQAEDGDRA